MINISRLELFEKLQQVVDTEKIPDIMKILDDAEIEYGFPQSIDIKVWDPIEKLYTLEIVPGKYVIPKLLAEYIRDLYNDNRKNVNKWLKNREKG